ncbi:MAG: DUF5067 domain-containing protein [Christensenellaceae bacterium]|nr:DUF5067 domain-containing protein [Christensenellaceae bacterium]
MKKLIAIILATIMMLGLVSTAFAAVDLSGMTVEELNELKHQIEIELSKLNAPTEAVIAGDLGTLHVAITKVVKGEDFEGNPAVTIEYYLTNNGNAPVSPITSVYVTASQNGKDLENTVVINPDDKTSMTTFEDIAPQTSKTLKSSYKLVDDSPVTVKASLLLDFTGAIPPLEATVDIK